ncbi:hypothetical protein [Lactococcus fujiensis]|uniref:Uncharacterized protein n=1 Tax=Lactococcus fujiensis JCM 16395 TaxID=1291764 RepID=A0A2A5RNQ7_9LACT|nr:hypothetical protein [Lactococcus fujiensis]PCS00974.1 hypothetical protein RT41_GL000764 [Lactococcus fujiensis JCM 16395]
MTFTNKNKSFEYNLVLNTANNTFEAYLTDNFNISGYGATIEEAVQNLEKIV